MAFSDALPTGLAVSGATTASQCGGTVNAPAGATTVSFSGGALAAGVASCSISVNVVAAGAGSYVNATANVSGLSLNLANSANATLTVVAADLVANAPVFSGGSTVG
ncbi:hypothetical protein IP84_17425, partial [beta proteobacterium AAP99]